MAFIYLTLNFFAPISPIYPNQTLASSHALEHTLAHTLWWWRTQYSASEGFPTDSYKLLSGFPRLDLTADPTSNNQSLRQAGLFPRVRERKRERARGIIFLQADNYPSNLEVTISENDFATVVSNGLMFEKLLFPPLMSLRSNIYVITYANKGNLAHHSGEMCCDLQQMQQHSRDSCHRFPI